MPKTDKTKFQLNSIAIDNRIHTIPNGKKTIQVSSQNDQDSSLFPQKIAQYKIESLIGIGGAGIVYRATDKDGAALALKVIQAAPSTSEEEIKRFILEAEMAKKLRQHPNIVTVYDTGCDGRNYYIAMELITGGKTFSFLKEARNNEKLSIKKVLDYAIPIADAISYAHKNGILHRDIKPANILINEFDEPILTDFGIAKNENTPKFTITGMIMGTPQYMSPEQCGFGDKTVSKQSDIYSFGVMLYEILTGKMPYSVHNYVELYEIFKVICSEEPIPPRKYCKEISRNLEAVLIRMLEKEKQLRYKDMEQVRFDLEACRNDSPVSIRRLSWAEKWEKWLRKNTKIALMSFATFATVLFVYFGFALPKIRESLYLKSKADVNAMAAKRKVSLLEKELSKLKNKNENLEDISTLLLIAREQIFNGNLNEAKEILLSLSEEAKRNSNKGIIIEAESWLGRIHLAQGDAEKSLKNFQTVNKIVGENSPLGELASFELALALEKYGKIDEAKKILTKVAKITDKFEKSEISVSLSSLATILVAKEKKMSSKILSTEKIDSSSGILKGLAYWTLAQVESDENKKRILLEKARKEKSVFIWIE